MSDLSFMSLVVAMLVVRAGEAADRQPAAGLTALVRDRFAGDPGAREALTAATVDGAGANGVPALAEAVRRHAEADRTFRAGIRAAVVAAYADPLVASGLPDPTSDG